ncbi:MAG: hypothetical protein GF398_06880 [Chitinivibrionales bacterium]|nr:hypothetical protein [Chitinivibrionales bacterium]
MLCTELTSPLGVVPRYGCVALGWLMDTIYATPQPLAAQVLKTRYTALLDFKKAWKKNRKRALYLELT